MFVFFGGVKFVWIIGIVAFYPNLSAKYEVCLGNSCVKAYLITKIGLFSVIWVTYLVLCRFDL
jgi:hypothetical protein